MGKREKLHYFRIYERQKAEDSIRDELECPADGKKKPFPSAKKFRAMVDDRLAKWHKEQ